MSTYRVLHPLLVLSLAALLTPTGACNGHGNGGGGGSNATPTPGTPVPGTPTPSGPPPLAQSRQFRALAGVSMGAYGAMNLGTKHSDIFSTIAALGGPVDMQQLLRDSVDDNLEVKPQTTIPRDVGDDFTYDHLAPYPDRDTRVRMFQDLTIAFGNPFLHHPDAARQYLGSDSEPAHIGRDDQFGTFTAPTDPLGFLDGGDENDDGLRQTNEPPTLRTEVSLLAKGSLPMIASGVTPVDVGGRLIADLNGDGIYDVGEGLVVNLSEPFQDTNGNGVFDPGEPFSDFGLDGVVGTGDYGENNGEFDYDPDRANYIAEDPLTRVNGLSAAAISTQRIYMDVGTKDQFGFARHYDHFVAALQAKGLPVAVQDGFSGNCTDLPSPSQQFLLVRYPAGHIGIESVDPGDILEGNVCGEATVSTCPTSTSTIRTSTCPIWTFAATWSAATFHRRRSPRRAAARRTAASWCTCRRPSSTATNVFPSSTSWAATDRSRKTSSTSASCWTRSSSAGKCRTWPSRFCPARAAVAARSTSITSCRKSRFPISIRSPPAATRTRRSTISSPWSKTTSSRAASSDERGGGDRNRSRR
jgi:Putative esterase